jgi:hypothetical protein
MQRTMFKSNRMAVASLVCILPSMQHPRDAHIRLSMPVGTRLSGRHGNTTVGRTFPPLQHERLGAHSFSSNVAKVCAAAMHTEGQARVCWLPMCHKASAASFGFQVLERMTSAEARQPSLYSIVQQYARQAHVRCRSGVPIHSCSKDVRHTPGLTTMLSPVLSYSSIVAFAFARFALFIPAAVLQGDGKNVDLLRCSRGPPGEQQCSRPNSLANSR